MINLISLLLKDINFFLFPDMVELDNVDDVTIIDMLTTSLLTCLPWDRLQISLLLLSQFKQIN